MLFEIKHDPKNYRLVAIKLWSSKLYGRTVKQRKRLTVLILSILVFLYFLKDILSLIFLILVFIILVLDFIFFMLNINSKVLAIKDYVLSGGKEIKAYIGDYFCFVQHGIELKRLEWNDLYEYCRIDKPRAISFRNKITNEVHVFYENEFVKQDFHEFQKGVESKIKVIPLV